MGGGAEEPVHRYWRGNIGDLGREDQRQEHCSQLRQAAEEPPPPAHHGAQQQYCRNHKVYHNRNRHKRPSPFYGKMENG